jgi:hypothetical protein
MQSEVKSGYSRDPAQHLTNQKLASTRTVKNGQTTESEVHCTKSYLAVWLLRLPVVGQDACMSTLFCLVQRKMVRQLSVENRSKSGAASIFLVMWRRRKTPREVLKSVVIEYGNRFEYMY